MIKRYRKARRVARWAAVIATAGLSLFLVGCTVPGDTIVEVEPLSNDRGGVAIETHGGGEYALREGVNCAVDQRLSECADADDYLVEQPNARDGDSPDRELTEEESAGSE